MSKFAELAREVSQKAAAIRCSKEEYREGLKEIRDELQNDIEASQ
jgi:hypothetical protein